METRPRTRLKLRGAALLAALGALVVPATAGAAVKTPVITKVTPKTANVGDKLVIYGKYFRLGRGKNRVLFKRTGGHSVFIKAGVSTKRRMTLVIPKRLEHYMAQPGGHPAATRFRLRVLTAKLSKRFTTGKNSPLIGPKKAKTSGPGPITPAPPEGDCDGDGLTNNVDTDDDNDLLPDTQEVALKLDPCSGDTDGDGVEDGYEYQSALDLNNDDYQQTNKIVPYPGKKPYPNPLYADASVDYDGDGLSLQDEYQLWKYTYTVDHTAARTLSPLSYSDGTQYSLSTLAGGDGVRTPNQPVATYLPPQQFKQWANANGYGTTYLYSLTGLHSVRNPYDLYDFDRNGVVTTTPANGQRTSEKYFWDYDKDTFVSDDERDEDADGLPNYEEESNRGGGRNTPEYWKGCYSEEGVYPVQYAGTSMVDADTDGDGILDGADDQDHDDVPNIMELSRNMASGIAVVRGCSTTGATLNNGPEKGFVNPFNPCLPDINSRTCQQHPFISEDFPPYDENGAAYYVLN
jgi:hypothetical protein